MSANPTSSYVHGTPPGEQRRLSRLNELLNEASLREWGQRSGATFGYAIAWAEGVKPYASSGAPARTGLL